MSEEKIALYTKYYDLKKGGAEGQKVAQVTSPTNWLSSNIVLVTAIGPLISSACAIPAPPTSTNANATREEKVTPLMTTPF